MCININMVFINKVFININSALSFVPKMQHCLLLPFQVFKIEKLKNLFEFVEYPSDTYH